MNEKAPAAQTSELAKTTIAGLLLAAAQAPLGSTMIAVGLSDISHSLQADIGLVTTLAVTGYLIVNIIGQSPGGKLSDLFGSLRTARLGMLCYALGASLGCFANSLGLLVVSRCVMALGGALSVPATIALLRNHTPAARRGRIFGLVGSTMSLSAAIGPLLGGELVSRFGWRAIFAASLPCLVLAALLVQIAPPPPQAGARKSLCELVRSFDWTGSALLSLALTSLVVLSKTSLDFSTFMLLGSLLLIGAFVLWELRAKEPVLDPRLFKRSAFTSGTLIIALQNFAMYGMIFQLSQYFTRLRGASAREVGQVLFPMMLCMFVCSPIGGRASDRFGSRLATLLGSLIMFAGALWLRRIGAFQTPSDAIASTMLVGVGLGLGTAGAQSAAMSTVPASQAGMAAGATSTMRYLGSVFTILMLGALLSGEGATALAAHEAAVHAFAAASALAVALCFGLPARRAETASP